MLHILVLVELEFLWAMYWALKGFWALEVNWTMMKDWPQPRMQAHA